MRDGHVLAAAQEERFTRKKHDSEFPHNAIRSCLEMAGTRPGEIAVVAFYDKPFLKFERLLETYLAFAPEGLPPRSARRCRSVVKDKLFQSTTIVKELKKLDASVDWESKLLFSEHHLSHAASAFYPSPFERAAVLTMDGVGEWTTTSLALGNGRDLKVMREIHFPHSLGLLYSAFTYYTGFKVNSGEYKVMGLAPYGEPKYVSQIKDHLIDIKDDGSFRLNLEYFDYCTGLTMTNGSFDAPVRRAGAQARAEAHAARDGPRRLDPGGHRGGDAQARARRGQGHRREEPLPRRRRGAQLRGERQAASRGSVRPACGCSPRRATPAARWGAAYVAHFLHSTQGRARRRIGLDAMRGAISGRSSRRRDRGPAAAGAVFEVHER